MLEFTEKPSAGQPKALFRGEIVLKMDEASTYANVAGDLPANLLDELLVQEPQLTT